MRILIIFYLFFPCSLLATTLNDGSPSPYIHNLQYRGEDNNIFKIKGKPSKKVSITGGEIANAAMSGKEIQLEHTAIEGDLKINGEVLEKIYILSSTFNGNLILIGNFDNTVEISTSTFLKDLALKGNFNNKFVMIDSNVDGFFIIKESSFDNLDLARVNLNSNFLLHESKIMGDFSVEKFKIRNDFQLSKLKVDKNLNLQRGEIIGDFSTNSLSVSENFKIDRVSMNALSIDVDLYESLLIDSVTASEMYIAPSIVDNALRSDHKGVFIKDSKVKNQSYIDFNGKGLGAVYIDDSEFNNQFSLNMSTIDSLKIDGTIFNGDSTFSIKVKENIEISNSKFDNLTFKYVDVSRYFHMDNTTIGGIGNFWRSTFREGFFVSRSIFKSRILFNEIVFGAAVKFSNTDFNGNLFIPWIKRVFDFVMQNGTSKSPFCTQSSTAY